jgi:hypothetical protein
MSLSIHLHAGDWADYEWGTLVPTFRSSARVHKKTLLDTLQSLYYRVGPWRTELEFRRTIAFMHEFVHFAQDLFTGIGCWDYLVQQKYLPRVLGDARSRSSEQPNRVPFARTEDVENYYEEIVYVPTKKLSARRRQKLLDAIGRLPDFQLRNVDDLLPCFAENLLESEAAVTVLYQYFNLEQMVSEDGEQIAKQNRALYFPGYMPEQYWSQFSFFLEALDLDLENARHNEDMFASYCWMFILVCDLACAHPSPRLLQAKGQDRIEYEPGIKFIRLVRAMNRLSEVEGKDFAAASQRKDLPAMEKILLDQCDYPYLTGQEVYEDWADLFAEMAKQDDDRVLAMRASCCRQRVNEPMYFIGKYAARSVEQNIPVYVLTPPGFVFFGINKFLFPEEQDALFVDLLKRSRDFALTSFFFGDGKYRCPLAESKQCDAATVTCLDGISRGQQFPPAGDCIVRHGLEACGFRIDGL